MPPRARATGATAKPAGLDKRLVLNGWMLSLFGEPDNQSLLNRIKDRELEGFDTDGVSKYNRVLALELPGTKRPQLTNDVLLAYDENIVRHWREITSPPERQGLTLKHFQYLALLFAEIYLDRYFDDRDALLAALNDYVAHWNSSRPTSDQALPFAADDLNKLAFWMATGAGKTLLMHINIRQYQHYLSKAGRTRELNRIILLTPNEGLSLQHLEELQKSGIEADLFRKKVGASGPVTRLRSSTSTSSLRAAGTKRSPSKRSRGTTSYSWTKATAVARRKSACGWTAVGDSRRTASRSSTPPPSARR